MAKNDKDDTKATGTDPKDGAAASTDPPSPPDPSMTLRADDPSEELLSYKRRCAALEGELDAALAKLETRVSETRALQLENTQLKARLQSQAASTLPDLGRGTAQLLTSVTIAQRGSTAPAHARKGDVVTTGDAGALQRRLGDEAKVFAVDPKVFAELEAGSHLLKR